MSVALDGAVNIVDYAAHRKTLSEKLGDLCRCGHERAKHAHAAAFCQGMNEGYQPCRCERFEERSEGTPGDELEGKRVREEFNNAR